MAQPTTIEAIAKKYSMSTDEFISLGSKLALKEKKKNSQIEKIEILARYSAETVNELQQKIKEGTVPEHPAWEDLIEIQNIEAEIKEIPRVQRYAYRPALDKLFTKNKNRDRSIYEAYVRYGYTMKEIAEYLCVHYTTISRIIRRVEK